MSAIGLGCWHFSGGRGLAGAYWPGMDQDAVRAVVRVSLEHGISWFDTAEAYGSGFSERALADALSEAGSTVGSVVVATKWSPFLRTSPSVLDSFRDREDALRPFPVDLHQAHHPGSLSPVEAVVRNLGILVKRKRIRAVGVCHYDADKIMRAARTLKEMDLVLASNQLKFSLLDRRIEANGVLQACQKRGVSIVATSALEQGLLTGSYHDDPTKLERLPMPKRLLPKWRGSVLRRSAPVIDALREIAERHTATPAQVALAWTLRVHGRQLFAVVGARSAPRARENAMAMQLELSDAEMRALDEVSRPFIHQPIG